MSDYQSGEDLIVTHYKGKVDGKHPVGLSLMTGRHPDSGNKLPGEQYVQLVADAKFEYPELCQNVARAASSLLLAHHRKSLGNDVAVIAGDGCPQRVGGIRMHGAKIMENIYFDAMPQELLHGIALHLQDVSDCTDREIDIVRHIMDQRTAVFAITHGYHAPRIARMYLEEMPEADAVTYTPEDVVKMCDVIQPQPYEKLAIDLVAAGAPTAENIRAEQRKEWLIYGPLRSISLAVRGWTRERVNIEQRLASWLRK